MTDVQIVESTGDSLVLKVNWGEAPPPAEVALWLNVVDGLAVVLDDQPQAETSIVKPSYWPTLCLYLTPGMARPVTALVGPAGNGKTTVAEAVLDVLGYPYEVLDMTEFVEPADLIGSTTYVLVDGQGKEVWRDGLVTRCFREGKALLINEFDAANPRAALCLQSVFQATGLNKRGRYVTTPEGRVYPKGDCPVILTMNTYGSGASRQYVGRNALDAASLDRMSVMTTTYEHETEILMRHGYSEETALALVAWAVTMRKRIDDNSLRVILSNRTLLRMAQGIEAFEWSMAQAIETEFLARLEADTRDLLVDKPAPFPLRRTGT